ncbi:protein kinase domain-containing protein [Actinomycetospora termitidis]|uniref:non-specific serine/threonine protein kinase n=1 Tax=Actinomycetospora termitidis TaxID=3053470 RepID=A0ABT7M8L6_9PSEU|nr:serine/threonine-protein kinase [Actinomycetospora sp. Odt1-22]MDL5155773.1 serine/threonine-protein kinase [Actinomycetospora sp. Odt1-22]
MEPGELFAERYRIVRFIARGGMGEVYEARDETLETTVALKRVGFAGLPDDEASVARARVLREARLAARLRGVPQVVATYDVVESGEDVWLVLEYVPSRTLADAVDDRLDPVEVARIGAAVATALAAAHANDVLHRDVKPGNVLLGADDTVKLTDFGISRGTGEATKLTATDVVSGTPAYMAREVARGEEPTPASDVYSLGATLYRAVEGAPPHGTDGNALRLMYRVATEPPRPPEHADTLAPLLLRLLADDPSTRPDAATAAELLEAHARRPSEETVRTGPEPHPSSGTPTLTGEATAPAPSRRRVWLLAGAAAAVLLVVAGVLVTVRLAAPDPLTMPATVAARTVDVPADQADPCALLDADALDELGTVSFGRAFTPTGCNATIRGGSGSGEVSAAFYAPRTPPPGGTTTTVLGGATLARTPDTPASSSNGCLRVLTIADGTQIWITATSRGVIPAGTCALAEAATAVVARTIDGEGVRADPGRPAQFVFGRSDACTALSAEELTRAVPDVPVTRGSPGFANWSCSFGRGGEVDLYYATDDQDPKEYGRRLPTPDGRLAWASATDTGCRVWASLGPASPGRPTQLTSAAVAGSPADLRCGQALTLARTLAGRLPPA